MDRRRPLSRMLGGHQARTPPVPVNESTEMAALDELAAEPGSMPGPLAASRYAANTLWEQQGAGAGGHHAG
ncbi:hypothetical protein [Allokutzneria sp. NRRL B-24872]|uniref:hypothetical protein n=1 Tax=Allokutzneria sp. NRRL B-24872 TaxID=1137961 RepID=UPI0011777E3D|nr:hypothetical protein [Allokutzneria sp. NRRL B-24872]